MNKENRQRVLQVVLMTLADCSRREIETGL